MNDYCQRLSADAVAIFLFHGVIREQPVGVRNYNRKHLLLNEFAALLDRLKKAGEAISMDDLVACQTAGETPPPNAFVITFDDGFENNHSIAASVLSDFAMPSLFYITSDFVDRNTMSWMDRIDEAFDRVHAGSVNLPWGEFSFHDRDTKIAVLDVIRARAKADPAIRFDGFASDIQAQLGVGELYSMDTEIDRKMSWAQVTELAEHPLFKIGGHTHTHAIMAHLDQAELDREIGTNLAKLESGAGVRTGHFAYPDGLDFCYDERSIDALKRHGIVCCPTAIDGINPPGTDLFHLRRIPVV